MQKVFIASAKRSAIGGFGGAISSLTPAALGAAVAHDTLACVHSGEPKAHLDEVIVGNVLGAGHGMNIARQVAIGSGLPVTTPAFTVNKVCGSGMKAITLAALAISSGESHAILAGGVESMSQAMFVAPTARVGSKLGHSELRDLILQDGLTDVFNNYHMGITAENLAKKFDISRDQQDAFALESQRKAAAAQTQNFFESEIAPLSIPQRGRDPIVFRNDEHPRPQTTIEALAKLRPAFTKDGTVTAGNASGINDGAAFCLLVSESFLKQHQISPLAEIVGWSSSGVEPEIMGIGPVEATKSLCRRIGCSVQDIELIEANEAFAAQAIAVNRALEWNLERVNVCGGAIALGHPIGASGARITVTLVHQMRRLKRKLGVATLCVGGGQGIAIGIRSC